MPFNSTSHASSGGIPHGMGYRLLEDNLGTRHEFHHGVFSEERAS